MPHEGERQVGLIPPCDVDQQRRIVGEILDRRQLPDHTFRQPVAEMVECPHLDLQRIQPARESVVLTAVLATAVQKHHSRARILDLPAPVMHLTARAIEKRHDAYSIAFDAMMPARSSSCAIIASDR